MATYQAVGKIRNGFMVRCKLYSYHLFVLIFYFFVFVCHFHFIFSLDLSSFYCFQISFSVLFYNFMFICIFLSFSVFHSLFLTIFLTLFLAILSFPCFPYFFSLPFPFFLHFFFSLQIHSISIKDNFLDSIFASYESNCLGD